MIAEHVYVGMLFCVKWSNVIFLLWKCWQLLFVIVKVAMETLKFSLPKALVLRHGMVQGN